MSPEEETTVVPSKPKRTPRKRVPKAVSDDADSAASLKRAPRKRAPKKVVPKDEERDSAPVKRKAPTPIAEERVQNRKSRKQLIVVSVMILLGVGASAAVGMTDKGTIDVQGIIAWRNEEARSSGNTGAIVAEQNTTQLPDGGLIGMGIGGPIEEASSTPAAASSTPSAASSTEPVGQVPLTNAEAEAAAAQATPTETTSQ